MRVKLAPPNAEDQHYLIDSAKFMDIVDPWDLSQRSSAEIRNAYHIYWLSEGENDVYEFGPPVFYLVQGVAKFINGRHRTLVLWKHMPAIPMALAHIDACLTFSPAPQVTSQQALEAIVVSKLDGNEIFDFPDLAIEYLGYDHNLGR